VDTSIASFTITNHLGSTLNGQELFRGAFGTNRPWFAILNFGCKIQEIMASVLTYFALLGGLVAFAVGGKMLLKKVKLL